MLSGALGIAATQSSGLREMFGTMCKPFHPGNAARNGLLAALLARKNFTSSNQAIEASRDFVNVLATRRNYDEITTDLGNTWEITANTYKPFACGIVVHPALVVHPLVLELTGKKRPQTGLDRVTATVDAAMLRTRHA